MDIWPSINFALFTLPTHSVAVFVRVLANSFCAHDAAVPDPQRARRLAAAGGGGRRRGGLPRADAAAHAGGAARREAAAGGRRVGQHLVLLGGKAGVFLLRRLVARLGKGGGGSRWRYGIFYDMMMINKSLSR